MKSRKTVFEPVVVSLEDLLGDAYVTASCAASAFLRGENPADVGALGGEKVDFYPESLQRRLLELLPRVGTHCVAALGATAVGATTAEFESHSSYALSPLSGLGYFRITEEGRLHLTSKSEHYHASMGHAFPGYRLLENARRLGIPNATHNNTRGFITRRLEEELIRHAAGVRSGDAEALRGVLGSTDPLVLNRVLNLDTGSLAAEAALKLILARFHAPQPEGSLSRFAGRVPVVLVVGDDVGGLEANYHGTTVLTQLMRGMWPDLRKGLENEGLFVIRAVPPNDLVALEEAFRTYDVPPHKVAGFFYEPVLMNFGARRLNEAFVRRLHELSEASDAPTVVDEIQTCVWGKELLFFREYGVRPSAVVVGKGFPGGEYSASRILFTSEMDVLPQFGALVTNGQEEIASLAYLVTMRWAEANASVTAEVGTYYQGRLRELASTYPDLVREVEGTRHLAGIYFHGLAAGKAFAERLRSDGLDISVQTYKAGCPPSALTKLPLIAGFEVVDLVVHRMEAALKALRAESVS